MNYDCYCKPSQSGVNSVAAGATILKNSGDDLSSKEFVVFAPPTDFVIPQTLPK